MRKNGQSWPLTAKRLHGPATIAVPGRYFSGIFWILNGQKKHFKHYVNKALKWKNRSHKQWKLVTFFFSKKIMCFSELSSNELKRLLQNGGAAPEKILLPSEIWSHFCYAKYNERVYNKFCFCRACYAPFTLKDSKGNFYTLLNFFQII